VAHFASFVQSANVASFIADVTMSRCSEIGSVETTGPGEAAFALLTESRAALFFFACRAARSRPLARISSSVVRSCKRYQFVRAGRSHSAFADNVRGELFSRLLNRKTLLRFEKVHPRRLVMLFCFVESLITGWRYLP
jgi:hypothetical protein